MKTTINVRIFLLLALVTVAFSCNKNKNTFLNRKYQNMVARYNVLYNGKLKLHDAVTSLKAGHKDDFKKILDVFPYGREEDMKGMSGQMDEVIKKCSKVISDRPLSKFIDDSYLLMGQAYFFKADYYAAIETFQYINSQHKGSEMSYKATLWIIKSYLRLNRPSEAEAIIGLLNNDPKFPEKQRSFFNEVSADVYAKQGKYSLAAEKLELALIRAKGASTKARYHYILGQLYEKQGKKEEARKHFLAVTRGNAPYDMAFNAKVNLARNYNPANKNEVKDARRFLKSMLKDDKNVAFFDQIYFELGNIERNEGNFNQAVEYYQKSNENNQGNTDQKALTHLALADLYFNKPVYPVAQAYYDSAVNFLKPEFENYTTLKAKQEVLTDLIKNLLLIHREDSLLKVSYLDKKEIDKMVDRAIEAEKEEADRRQKEAEKKKLQPGNNPMLPTPGSLPPTQTAGAAFYFDDKGSVARGYTEFLTRFGDRKNVDNWRYRSMTLGAQEDSNEDNEEKEGNGNPEKNPDKSPTTPPGSGGAPERQQYLKDIPFSPEAREAANERIAGAYLRVGEIYYENLKEFKEASINFNRFVARYPEHVSMPKALYYLYKCNMDLQNPSSADSSKSKLISKYPESPYAQALTQTSKPQPGTESQNGEVNELYTRAYAEYQAHRYNQCLQIKREHDKKFFGSAIQSKFDLLEAMAYGETDSLDLCLKKLEAITGNHTSTPEGLLAQKMINNYKKLKSEKQTQNKEVPGKVAYQFAPDQKHVFLYLIPQAKGIPNTNTLKARFSDYHKTQFPDKSFSIEELVIGPRTFIMIKEFNNSDEAQKYFDIVKSDKKFLPGLAGSGYEIFITDTKNLGLMVVNSDLEGFKAFIKEYYQN